LLNPVTFPWTSTYQERSIDISIEHLVSIISSVIFVVFIVLTYVAWRRYLWASESVSGHEDTRQYSLTDVYGDRHLVNVPHQEGVQWLTEIFSRSVRKSPDLTALQIAHAGECPSSNKWNRRSVYLMESFVHHFQFTRRVVGSANDVSRWSFF
jgi:hypothetical protein